MTSTVEDAVHVKKKKDKRGQRWVTVAGVNLFFLFKAYI